MQEPETRQLLPTPSTPDRCFGITAERAYYKHEGFFIKRSLRPSEFKTGVRGLHIPLLGVERLRNEAESLQFIRRVSNIPVPQLYGAFELDGSYVLIMEYIQGTTLSELPEHQQQKVFLELNQHLDTLHNIKSKTIGGPSGTTIPPNRVLERTDNNTWPLLSSEGDGYIFCHNDLSQYNIIVDPTTLRIKAIIDWEYAGFFPVYFEASFYKRPGPSSALNGEIDDVPELLQFLSGR